MFDQTVRDDLLHTFRGRGYAIRIVPIQRLQDLEEGLKNHYKSGYFDEEFYQERLTRFDFSPPNDFPSAKSVIIVAFPRAQTEVVFHYKGSARTLIIPPTYVGYLSLPEQVESLLNEILAPFGYHALKATRIPLKPLAVHCGLAEYGRNNITYVSGMGSFQQLAAAYSDLPCLEDSWQDLKMMKRCEKCHACMKKCPTGAISLERFLLHAERCLVFHNEKPANVPFPDWIDPTWHNSLIGCMLCQRYCPADREFIQRSEKLAEFSEAETSLLLEGVPLESLPVQIRQKFEQLEMLEYVELMSRNLGMFF